MSDLPKAFDPKKLEKKWYKLWQEKGFFRADPHSNKAPYCIVMPPPNVTGVLHMGHALVNTLQDILIRWHRMLGDEVLWVPGTDHAGIATQTVVERHLMKTLGKRRQDFSREQFLSHVWKWKEENAYTIVQQLKSLGCSCDWSRECFTMDDSCSKAVRTLFKKMYDDGLIYRGDYLVNWDPVTQTAVADLEVEYEERQSFIWYFRYPLQDGTGFATVATTRPETMLGDTAVAVHPRDPRYASMIGKTAILPLMNREIPIIADPAVDPAFGTGMVKVTPAHDPNDYQMGISHKLPFITIMTPNGQINEQGGPFAGLTMAEAREKVVQEMKNLGLLDKVVPHTHRVGLSYRSKAVIEPYMSKQWFVRMGVFGQKLRECVQNGHFTMIPKNWESSYFHWADNLHDWCISRQLWWGHRIPIWYHVDDPTRIICHAGSGEPAEVQQEPDKWVQDEDSLDTWFSSGLWPFSTLGWPDKTPDFTKFYPNSVLVTGHDILFFWVARMLFMGEYATGQIPFPEVFLHGLIYGKSYWRDNENGGITYASTEERRDFEKGKPLPEGMHFKWEKMSKSKGNIIDPLEIIDEYGTDALRMALCASTPQSREIDLDLRRFEEFKNFANKIWNGARFVFMNLEGLTSSEFSEGLLESELALEDRWIFSVLNRTIKDVNAHLAAYLFDQAALTAYDFFWKEFCSNYVEISKPILQGKVGTEQARKNKQKILAIVLGQALRLIHPMAPFITEELFFLLQEQLKDVAINETADPYTQEAAAALLSAACIVAPYPKVLRESDRNQEIEEAFALIEQIVYTARNIRGEMKLPSHAAIELHLVGREGDSSYQLLKERLAIISALVRTKKVVLHTQMPSLGFASSGIVGTLTLLIPLPEELLEQEKIRLSKEQERLDSLKSKLRLQLENREFVANAPAELVEKQQKALQKTEAELLEIFKKLKLLAKENS